jgi:hypothetical protein
MNTQPQQPRQLPWETPRISMILSIFGGRVASINTVNKEVKLQVGGDKDEVQR